ncbi:hypothetical protein NRI_0101 [Neorickettsia risticii str. Illinois]|uniref:Uncharacterized protein n=1 Tax=Neorickettsia risticii (strain Illinois) TaxID=434131 RepID=C6V3Y2_NEORI|nr:hypothetical protein NRI_0101 [Neorickettsia risticii str. Illinois]
MATYAAWLIQVAKTRRTTLLILEHLIQIEQKRSKPLHYVR